MSNYFKTLMLSQSDSANNNMSKILLILEVVLVTFLITLIPELIIIGRPPTLDEIYVPLLSSSLMAIYAYIRIRNIEVE